uniref:Cell wall integrity and stress response component 3-like n=1 Tax=Dermatophagoides pteronyssinus TaxID=6956 RepID=A0A6P6XTE0_DERPT|nr:cell wall integrity and stress response component 3-like [Dermatophagoides pteronyssinus]
MDGFSVICLLIIFLQLIIISLGNFHFQDKHHYHQQATVNNQISTVNPHAFMIRMHGFLPIFLGSILFISLFTIMLIFMWGCNYHDPLLTHSSFELSVSNEEGRRRPIRPTILSIKNKMIKMKRMMKTNQTDNSQLSNRMTTTTIPPSSLLSSSSSSSSTVQPPSSTTTTEATITSTTTMSSKDSLYGSTNKTKMV